MKILIDNGHGIDTKGKRSPAVLTENLFMDNPSDCDFLLSEEGRQALVDLHVDGICAYLAE